MRADGKSALWTVLGCVQCSACAAFEGWNPIAGGSFERSRFGGLLVGLSLVGGGLFSRGWARWIVFTQRVVTRHSAKASLEADDG